MTRSLVWVQIVRAKPLPVPEELMHCFYGLTLPALPTTAVRKVFGRPAEVVCVLWQDVRKVVAEAKHLEALHWCAKECRRSKSPYFHIPVAAIDPSAELRRTPHRMKSGSP